MSKAILLRWKTDKGNFCKIIHRDILYQKFLAFTSNNEKANDSKVEDIKEIILSSDSISWNEKNINAPIPLVLEYWYPDGNTSQYTVQCTVEPEEMNIFIKNILEKVIFEYAKDTTITEIPENVQLTWIINGHKKEKEVSRLDLMDSFSSYIYTDPMNNGIAKKIMSIIPYCLSWYINWDNNAEINALYYEYGKVGFKNSISISGIHRKIWGEFKKLCDIEN